MLGNAFVIVLFSWLAFSVWRYYRAAKDGSSEFSQGLMKSNPMLFSFLTYALPFVLVVLLANIAISAYQLVAALL